METMFVGPASRVRGEQAVPVPRHPHYRMLDVWRGIACLAIVVLHATHNANEARDTAGPVGAGILTLLWRLNLGVPIFFVISGYCIAATADSARRKPRAPARFFYRRFRRIFPPYWVLALMSMGLAGGLAAVGQGDLVWNDYGHIPRWSFPSWSQWLGNATLTETWRPHLFGDSELKAIGPAWTLCYEEQFYAVCGLVLVVAPRHFFATAAVVTVLTLVVAPLAMARPDLLPIQGFFFDGRWLMFAEGIAVYYLLNYAPSAAPGKVLAALGLVATGVLRWLVPAVAANALASERTWELVGSTAFALGLLVLHRWDARMAHWRILRPVAGTGRMCFSLYLVHWPVTLVLTTAMYRAGVRGLWPTLLVVAPIAVGASIAASRVFHLVVERRFMNTRPSPAGATVIDGQMSGAGKGGKATPPRRPGTNGSPLEPSGAIAGPVCQSL